MLLSEERSRPLVTAASMKVRMTNGAPDISVTRSRSIRLSASSTSHLYISTIRCPEYEALYMVLMPAIWKKGYVTSLVDPRAAPPSSARISLLSSDAAWLRWVPIAPLGCAFVPEVYKMVAVSSGETTQSGGSAPPVAWTRSAYAVIPAEPTDVLTPIIG